MFVNLEFRSFWNRYLLLDFYVAVPFWVLTLPCVAEVLVNFLCSQGSRTHYFPHSTGAFRVASRKFLDFF